MKISPDNFTCPHLDFGPPSPQNLIEYLTYPVSETFLKKHTAASDSAGNPDSVLVL